MRTLQPPLATLERDLFQPSDALILRWTQGETLPPGVAEALAADTDARARRADLEQAAAEAFDIDFDRPPPPLPAALRARIQRRVAVRNATFAPIPQAGQIVRIDALPGRSQELPRPLTVLLAEPAATPNRWSGWLVVAETDYAGPWDLLLGPEDEPCDPLARVVQVWNPVHLDPTLASRVLAQLSPARLAAVQALAAAYASGVQPTADSATRSVWARQIGEHRLLTGTPLSSANDPRHRYQQLYTRVAQTVFSLPAPSAQRPANVLTQLADWLRDWAAGCSVTLTALTPLAQPMGDDEPAEVHERHYQLANLARLRLRLDEAQALVHVRLERVAEQTLHVECREAAETILKATLNAEHPAVELAINPQRPGELIITDQTGQTSMRIPLSSTHGG